MENTPPLPGVAAAFALGKALFQISNTNPLFNPALQNCKVELAEV
jgi:hypothetical protein